MFNGIVRFFLLSTLFFAFSVEAIEPGQPLKTPPPVSEVDAEVADAQAKFEIAKKMFNPWYAGPLLTPGPHNLDPGLFNIQPYLFFTWNHGRFTDNRKSESIPTIFSMKQTFSFQVGLLSWLDTSVGIQGIYNHQSNKSAYHFGDTSLSLGFQLLHETPYRPALRFTVSESFPTGKYQRLNSTKNGIDAVGSGAYVTTLTLITGKVVWWISDHPMAFRAAINYSIPSHASVNDFNAYGGGFETKGTVNIGNTIAADVSIEYSFTKNWAFALDVVYTNQGQSTFSGNPGLNLNGTPATVGSPSNDLFSLAPALEYNPFAHLGFLAGVWVPVTGRNTNNFVSCIFSMFYVW